MINKIIRSISYVKVRGIDVLRNPFINKGTSFTLKERQLLRIHGLLPPAVNTLEEQAIRVMINLRKIEGDLSKHMFLSALQDRHEILFYKIINDNIEYCMPLIYTPTVGLACQKYGLMFRRPRGLYVTIHDKRHIRRILNNWPHPQVKAIVVTDGERILGLGDLGCSGISIPIGKLALYTALAGVPPQMTLPVLLDVGTNNQELLDDPLYLGLRHKRVRGKEYDEFLDLFMDAVADKYGRHCLIQFEDFGAPNAYRILNKYRENFCVFNDDIQGTASVSLAGLLAAEKLSKRHLKDNVFLFFGAGSAATGIANLIKRALFFKDVSESAALAKIFMFDVDGLLTSDRAKETLTPENQIYCKEMPPIKSFLEAVKAIKPTAILGVSGVYGAFTKEVLEEMSRDQYLPYIFALSNPTSKAECNAIDAYTHTKGNCVFACGSPFEPVTVDGKMYTPSQCNNSYIFPGVALAIILFRIRPVTVDIFLAAARSLASLISDEELADGRIFPALYSIREVSANIAVDVARHAYSTKIAHTLPEPNPKIEFIKKHWFTPRYHRSLPQIYRYQASDNLRYELE